jgi:hypothetical protein
MNFPSKRSYFRTTARCIIQIDINEINRFVHKNLYQYFSFSIEELCSRKSFAIIYLQ